jgi:hypothetical protein
MRRKEKMHAFLPIVEIQEKITRRAPPQSRVPALKLRAFVVAGDLLQIHYAGAAAVPTVRIDDVGSR